MSLLDVVSRMTMRLPQNWERELSGSFSAIHLSCICTFTFIVVNSEVHKAIHKSTGTLVALKRILMHNEKEGMPVTALREIKILKALKHPCIVEILDMFVVRSTYYHAFSSSP